MNKWMKNNKGFTLVELLVVISIISLLSSVVMASLNSARAKARDVRRIMDMRQIQTALAMYYDQHGSYPDGDGDGCGGWDAGNQTLPLFGNGALNGIMNKPSVDPTATGNCSGYFYYHYPAGAGQCDVRRGAFYVLTIGSMDTVTPGQQYPTSPGFACPGFNWSVNGAWTTGEYEN
jgi:prepilin-type N-terminal cleavage/methylation domain-containing protein